MWKRLRHLLPMLTIFAVLTDPAGRSMYVVKSQVVAILTPVDCDARAHAKVYTMTVALCVAEDVAEATRKVSEQ
jgi:hypothetical protein